MTVDRFPVELETRRDDGGPRPLTRMRKTSRADRICFGFAFGFCGPARSPRAPAPL